MEGIEPAKYNEVLGLTALGYGALCVCAVGYRSPDDAYAKAAKVRFENEELIQNI